MDLADQHDVLQFAPDGSGQSGPELDEHAVMSMSVVAPLPFGVRSRGWGTG